MKIHKSALYNVVSGDLIYELDSGEVDVLIHICNCMHKMGAGFAHSLRTMYPEVYDADLATSIATKDKLGTNSYADIVTPSGHKVTVVNMYAQYAYGRESKQLEMDKLNTCLEEVALNYRDKRIVMPRIGAGLSGGSWYDIARMIHVVLCGLSYKIYVHMYIGIKNVRDGDSNSKTVLCDRSTVLGNKYPLSKYTRDESCDLHYDLLLKQLYYKPDQKVTRAMKSLYSQAKSGNLSLSCHCYPKRCHTMNIRDVLYMKHYAKVIVAGSRKFTMVGLLNDVLDARLKMFEHVEIVSGLAKGADTFGLEYAKDRGIPYKEFPARWADTAGKPSSEIRTNAGGEYWVKAGYARNEEMANYANVLIAFDSGTNGTKDMIALAKAMHLLVFVVKC